MRIVRQLLTESLLLSLAGAGLGVLVAYLAIAFLVPRLPDHSYPYEADFHVNLAVLCFSVALAVLSGIVFGLFPALQSAADQRGDAGGDATPDRQRERQALTHGVDCRPDCIDSAIDDCGGSRYSGIHSDASCPAWIPAAARDVGGDSHSR